MNRQHKSFDSPDEVRRFPNGIGQLVHIGLQGKRIAVENLPASNLVFLIDVSGSMNQPNKLPLVKRALGLLVRLYPRACGH